MFILNTLFKIIHEALMKVFILFFLVYVADICAPGNDIDNKLEDLVINKTSEKACFDKIHMTEDNISFGKDESK